MQALGAKPKYLHTLQIQKPPNEGRTGVVTTLAEKKKPCPKVPHLSTNHYKQSFTVLVQLGYISAKVIGLEVLDAS